MHAHVGPKGENGMEAGDLSQPDYELFPEMRGLTVYEAELKAGEQLFIPENTPHQA